MIKAGLPKLLSANRGMALSTTRSIPSLLQTSLFNNNKSLFHTSTRANSKIPYIDVSHSLDKNGIESTKLISQRKQRPLSPHLTIYQPQLTWYMSSLHRLSLIVLALGFYLVTMLFGASSLFNFNLSSDKLINWYHDKVSRMNKWVSLSIKASAAYLFALQYGGAIRHLIWDTAKELSLKGVYRTGYALIGFTVVAGSWLLTL
ncbi:succinate dehydrogenase [ubiquinone] cytochrome b subunit, mitochondrial [Monosporozyma servazzii]